jgi:fatty acid desaturase
MASARAEQEREPIEPSDVRPAPIRRGAEIAALKQRDNVTNFGHIAFVYAIIAVTIAATITLFAAIERSGWGLSWQAPVALVAIAVIGASQHQFGGAIHEATHHILFDNRTLNELASDWLVAFPIYTSTFAFRLHHLAHHQFINDPERDPDFAQLQDSGHHLDFPITHVDMLRALVRQLWLPNLFRYTIARARYSALGGVKNPYVDMERPGAKLPVLMGVAFAAGMPALLVTLLAMNESVAAFSVLGVSTALILLYYASLREEAFPRTHLKPVISHKTTAIGRILYMALLYGALSAIEARGWGPAWAWFGVLWIVPLFTTFPLFMIMRQWVQHGNADRGRLTNTRVFLVNPLIRYAVFPFGMDIHLPHHMYASVPHYRLKELHALLMKDRDYQEKGIVVEGYFRSPHRSPPEARNPTVMEVLGPAYAPREASDIYVDNAAIAEADVADQEALDREVRLSELARE